MNPLLYLVPLFNFLLLVASTCKYSSLVIPLSAFASLHVLFLYACSSCSHSSVLLSLSFFLRIKNNTLCNEALPIFSFCVLLSERTVTQSGASALLLRVVCTGTDASFPPSFQVAAPSFSVFLVSFSFLLSFILDASAGVIKDTRPAFCIFLSIRESLYV